MVNQHASAVHAAHRRAHFVQPAQVVEVEAANQIGCLQERVGLRLVAVEQNHFVGILHPVEEIREIVRCNHVHVLPFPFQILIQPQRRAYGISVGGSVAQNDHVLALIKNLFQLCRFLRTHNRFQHDFLFLWCKCTPFSVILQTFLSFAHLKTLKRNEPEEKIGGFHLFRLLYKP